MLQKKRKKHDKIIFLAKSKINRIEVLTGKVLIEVLIWGEWPSRLIRYN